MTRFGPSIEPITFPTPSRYATCYVTDAGHENSKLLEENEKKTIEQIFLGVNRRNKNVQTAEKRSAGRNVKEENKKEKCWRLGVKDTGKSKRENFRYIFLVLCVFFLIFESLV